MRSVYCAFAISSMLNDWSGVDLPRSLTYIHNCAVSQHFPPHAFAVTSDRIKSYEGGFAQTPFSEAIGENVLSFYVA